MNDKVPPVGDDDNQAYVWSLNHVPAILLDWIHGGISAPIIGNDARKN